MDEGFTERRSQRRCTRDIGMYCAPLAGRPEQVVTLRNFTAGGLYFEAGQELPPGTFIVLRAMPATDLAQMAASPAALPSGAGDADIEACSTHRNHTVARVLRCRCIDDHPPRYGIGAAVQVLADG